MAISGTFSAGNEKTFKNVSIDVDQTPATPSWKPIESWATNITVAGGDTPTQTTKTYTTPVTGVGERNSFTVTVECLYTEVTTAPFVEIYDDYAGDPGLRYDVRWSPSGGASGDVEFTTTGGKLVDCTLPAQPADDGTPVRFQFVISCNSITRGTAT